MRILELGWALLAVAVSGMPEGLPIEGLRAKDVDARRAAANKVRLADRALQREALPVLIDLLLKEKDGQVRLAVLDAVTALGPDAAPAVPALLHTMRTDYGGLVREETHQDYRSALALASVGKPAVEGLRGLLKERKEHIRAEAVMGLGRIGPDAGAAVPDLVPLLTDKSDRIRREASVALGRIGMAAVGPLVAASEGTDVTARAGAVEAMGRLATPADSADRALLKGADDPAPEVRAAALRGLARSRLPDEAVRPILGANLRHGDESVRLAAVDLLVGRKALLRRMATDLGPLLSAEDDGVARVAAFLLGEVGPDAAPLLLDALRRKDSRIEPIAEALAQIGRPLGPLLAKAIDDPEPRVRRGAALALGQIRPPAPGTVPKLTAGLADPDPGVKAAFLTAVGYLGPRAEESMAAVRALLRDKSAEIRLQVIDILARSSSREGALLDDLTSLVDDDDTRVQSRAIDAIRSLGPAGRKALPLVIGKLEGKDAGVRLASVEFVESHGQAAADAIPALCPLLGDPAPRIRMIAAQALGKLGRPAQPAFDRLASLLGDDHVEVREAATTALGNLELDAEAIRSPLARALRDDKPEVRRAATRAIQRLGPRGAIFVPDIILLARSRENQRTVDRLLRPFEASGPDARSVPELVKQLDHDQAAVRLLAIKFLGLAGKEAGAAVPALERLRDDPDAKVREQSKAAIGRIKDGPAPATPMSRDDKK